MSGKPRPNKLNVTSQILRGSDLRRKNVRGQTILFNCVKEGLPLALVKTLLKHGADVTSRDIKAQTVRDHASSLGRHDYVKCFNSHVIDIMRQRDVTKLNQLILRGYGDDILEILETNDPDVHAINHDLIEKRSMQEVASAIEAVPLLQVHDHDVTST